jgi:crotonobetainyl-CoA:carnitine CoA-transferase CaiB-like acyl-CoA transferase
MISLTGEREDGPRKTATTIGDYVAGTNAAFATAAALAETPRTGRRVDVSLRDGLMAVQSGWNALNFVNERQPERTGTASPFLAPNQVFQAADRPFTLAIVSDRHFAQMVSVMGQEELRDKYPSNDIRMEQQSDLVAALSRTFITLDADHWVDLFGSVGIPAGHVLTLDEAFEDPQARHHEMLVEFEHPVAGLVQTTGSPLRLDDMPARSARVPPTLGQNTKELLIEMGVDTDTVTEMIEDGRAVTS